MTDGERVLAQLQTEGLTAPAELPQPDPEPEAEIKIGESFLSEPDAPPVISNTYEGFQQAIAMTGYGFRWNTRGGCREFRGPGTANKWIEFNDRKIARLRTDISMECAFSAGSDNPPRPALFNDTHWKLYVDSMLADKEVDPELEWLKSLVWDGGERLDNLLSDLWDISANGPHVSLWATRGILAVPVIRSFDPGTKFDQTVVLYGAESLGKSAFCEHAVPEQFRDEGYIATIDLAGSLQHQVETMDKAFIIEISEMLGSRKSDVSRTKNFMSRTKDKVRKAYERYAETNLRRAGFIGTVNPEEYLSADPAQQRRFATFDIAKKPRADCKRYFKLNIEQIYAEIVHKYKQHGEEYFAMSEEAKREQRVANQKVVFEPNSIFQEEAQQVLYNYGVYPISLRQLKNAIDAERRKDIHKSPLQGNSHEEAAMKRLFRGLGWTPSRQILQSGMGQVRIWVPPNLDTKDQDAVREAWARGCTKFTKENEEQV